MLVIRFQRIGKKHQPSYRIAVAEARSKAGGPPTEQVGTYDPFTKQASIQKDRVAHWLKMGAKPSDTVWNLLVREKAVEGKARAIKMKVKKASADAQPARPAGAIADKAAEAPSVAHAVEGKTAGKPAEAAVSAEEEPVA
ncbi:MAG: 30S ribosomal protein S16 [Candidatus Liptonbacteria bacterium]|nr:30S ribosomal protein S16 [Candidatus Liptonbacteria bacterium]